MTTDQSDVKRIKIQESHEDEEGFSNSVEFQELANFLMLNYPNVGLPKIEVMRQESKGLKAKLYFFGDVIETFESFESEMDAKNMVCKVALNSLQRFHSLVMAPVDEIQKEVVDSIHKDLVNYVAEEFPASNVSRLTQAALSISKSNINEKGGQNDRSYKTCYSNLVDTYCRRHKLNLNIIYKGENNKFKCVVRINQEEFFSDLFVDRHEAKNHASKQAWESLTAKEKEAEQKHDMKGQLAPGTVNEMMDKKPHNNLIQVDENIAQTHEDKASKKYVDFVNDYFVKQFSRGPFYQFKESLSKFICFIEFDGKVFESSPANKKIEAKENLSKKIFDYLENSKLPARKSAHPDFRSTNPPPPMPYQRRETLEAPISMHHFYPPPPPNLPFYPTHPIYAPPVYHHSYMPPQIAPNEWNLHHQMNPNAQQELHNPMNLPPYIPMSSSNGFATPAYPPGTMPIDPAQYYQINSQASPPTFSDHFMYPR